MAGREGTGRDEHGRWLKGYGGGRPKTPKEVKDRLKEMTPEALETVIAAMRDKKQPMGLRVACANSILDRALGKPKISVDGDVDHRVEIVLEGVEDYAG